MFRTEEGDPLDALESGGELAGYVWRKAGAEGLRDLLTRHDGVSREFIMDLAVELQAAGLQKAAGIAAEVAAATPPMTDLRFCCYTKPPYTDVPGNEANIQAWVSATQRRQRERERLSAETRRQRARELQRHKTKAV